MDIREKEGRTGRKGVTRLQAELIIGTNFDHFLSTY